MKNKKLQITKKRISCKMILVVLALCTSSVIFSQEKPFRIGVKIGFPNVIGGNIEYALPLLGNKLAISIDYSTIKVDKFLDPDTGKMQYFEAGINYYFFKEGKGLYSNISYGILNADLTLTEIESNIDFTKIGTGIVNQSINSFNIKLGAKLGNGFYFRPEIGYAFTSLPQTIDVNVKFPDGSSEIQVEELPSELTSGLLFNIGFGVAF